MIHRTIYNDLKAWKENPKRKPLLLQGARQVGKTFVISHFGKSEYKNFVYINFEQESNIHFFFKGSLIPKDIIENLSIYFGKKIDPKDTLIFFDEIQVLPEVLTSLKYFLEQAPEFNIIAAGSLLGVSIASHLSFPVGKVNFLSMYPISFLEYLNAVGENLLTEKIISTNLDSSIDEIWHNKLLSHYKLYLYLGGMPEVVQDYIDNKDIEQSRKIQHEILESYKRDFSKYNDKIGAVKTSQIWNSIPYQLAKESKKFKYNDVKPNSRASTYLTTIEWLKNAGLIIIAYDVSTPKIPLSSYADKKKFKIYLHDTGLLGAMLNIPSRIISDQQSILTEFKGAFIENFVAQELTVYGRKELFYWTSKSDAEIDFLIEQNGNIYPLEVKSGYSRRKRSLKSYEDKYKPKQSFRMSPRNLIQSDKFVNIPLYASFMLNSIIPEK